MSKQTKKPADNEAVKKAKIAAEEKAKKSDKSDADVEIDAEKEKKDKKLVKPDIKDDKKKKAEKDDIVEEDDVDLEEEVDDDDLEEEVEDNEYEDGDEYDEYEKEIVGKSTGFKKTRNLTKKYFFVSVVAIVLAVAVFFLFGPSASIANVGGVSYSATLKNYFPASQIDNLKKIVDEVGGVSSEVRLSESVLTGKQILEIRLQEGEYFRGYEVIKALNSEYPYLHIEYFTQSNYSALFTVQHLITFSVVLGLILLSILIVSSLLFGGKNGFFITFITLNDFLMIVALYILFRVPSPHMLIAAGGLVCLASPYFAITKITALEKNKDSVKKRRAYDAALDILNSDMRRTLDTLIVAVLLLVAFVAVGLIMKSALLGWFGAAVFAVFTVSVYSSAFLVPNAWGLRRAKKKKKR